MAKKAWWDVGSWFGGGEDEETTSSTGQWLQSPIYTDPAKKAVSDKLSSYLTSQVGQGASPYTGALTTSLDPLAQARYNEYMGMDPSAWFEKSVTQPTMSRFKEELLPEINESWAGGLRGSGRYRDVEDYSSSVSEKLGEVGAKAIPSIYESQLGLGYKQAELDKSNKALEYNEWLREQPEYNPVLEQALKYLGSGTSTGETSYVKYLPPESSAGASASAGFDWSSMDWSKLLNSFGGQGGGGGGGGDWTSIFQNVYDWFGSW